MARSTGRAASAGGTAAGEGSGFSIGQSSLQGFGTGFAEGNGAWGNTPSHGWRNLRSLQGWSPSGSFAGIAGAEGGNIGSFTGGGVATGGGGGSSGAAVSGNGAAQGASLGSGSGQILVHSLVEV